MNGMTPDWSGQLGDDGYVTQCIHEIIDERATYAPDRIAVVDERRALAYAELRDASNALARVLLRRDVSLGERIGVRMHSGVDGVVAVLGILKAGCAYVTVPLAYPSGRVAAITAETDIRYLLVNNNSATEPVDRCEPVEVALDTLLRDPDNRAGVLRVVQLDDVAFVRFTSGSTGRPKGVINTHRSIVSRLGHGPLPEVNASDTSWASTSAGFGTRVFYPLVYGNTLVVASDRELADPMRLLESWAAHRVTSAYLVPSLAREIMAIGRDRKVVLPSLRVIGLGGEAFTEDLTTLCSAVAPNAQLVSLYGSSEIGTAATLNVVDADDPATWRRLGRELPHTRVYVLDQELNEVAPGHVGEICISSPHLALGYVNDAAATRQRFVPNPFLTGTRLYRTGDMGRKHERDFVEVLGRRDRQVKIRGHRVELDEVEAALLACPGISSGAVLMRQGDVSNQIVAYYVTQRELSHDALRRQLRLRLSPAMIPSSFIRLDCMPLGPTGKVDRQALASLEEPRPSLLVGGDSIEERVAKIWREALGEGPGSVESDFFECGGDSLGAVRMAAQIWKEFDVEIAVSDFLLSPTPSTLASLIATADRVKASAEQRV